MIPDLFAPQLLQLAGLLAPILALAIWANCVD